MFLLDTDIFSLLFDREHEIIIDRIKRTDALIGVTIVTRIEKLRGRFESILKAANGNELLIAVSRLEQTERDVDKFPIFSVTSEASATFDKLLKIKKLNIDHADKLQASIALANKATLVTRNLKDFKKVPVLKIENWAD